MKINEFKGIVPKASGRKLSAGFATLAENVDLYGGILRGLPSPTSYGSVIDVRGNICSRAESLHIVDGMVIGFPTYTTIATDPLRRYGSDTFIFVEDGELWRSSPARVAQSLPPTRVVPAIPTTAPTVASLSGAGCNTSIPIKPCGTQTSQCLDMLPPVATAYRYTYINACGDESAPSPISDVIDIEYGDAATVSVGTVPEGHKAALYRLVTGSKGEAVWLLVEESSSSTIVDGKCPEELMHPLREDRQTALPACIAGVAEYGSNQLLVWTNKHLYLSNPMQPHMYDEVNKFEVEYNIQTVVSVRDESRVGGAYAQVLTDGYHYTLSGGKEPAIVRQSEWLPCMSKHSAVHGEGITYYASECGLCAMSATSAKNITAELMTETEWQAYRPAVVRAALWGGRLWMFGRAGGMYMQISDANKLRDVEWCTTTFSADACVSAIGQHMYVSVGSGLYRWCTGEPMKYRWSSGLEGTRGGWYPTTLRITAERAPTTIVPEKVYDAFRLFTLTHTKIQPSVFFDENPEYRAYAATLLGDTNAVHAVVTSSTGAHYARDIRHNRPVRLPRLARRLWWGIELSGTLPVIDVTLQSSIADMA